jgi:hypothetical protein
LLCGQDEVFTRRGRAAMRRRFVKSWLQVVIALALAANALAYLH